MDVARAPTARGTDKAALPGQIWNTVLKAKPTRRSHRSTPGTVRDAANANT